MEPQAMKTLWKEGGYGAGKEAGGVSCCELRGPDWIQIPQGESQPSTSLWVQHQFWRESGRRLPSSPRLGQGLDQSSPRSESDDDLSSAISRMAFSMGARLPLGVMPMGWMTCSLQPGRRGGEGNTNLQQTTQEQSVLQQKCGVVETAQRQPRAAPGHHLESFFTSGEQF